MEARLNTEGPAPSPADVEVIAALFDPVVRNLRITQAYYDISAAVHRDVTLGANWCSFATWASRQAGRTIRGEDLVEALKRRAVLPSRWLNISEMIGRWLVRQGLFDPETRLGRLANATYSPIRGLEAASRDIADGNRKVFEEIGFEFARFLATRAADAAPDEAGMAAFASSLRAGPPPDGQDFLRLAFANYYKAKFTASSSDRAQLEYLANLQIGFHEQIRLQPQIEAGMTDVPVEKADWGLELLSALFPSSQRWWTWLRKSLAPVLRVVMGPARRLMLSLVRNVVTQEVMTLTVTGRTFSLADAIPMPFSPDLVSLTDSDLIDLMESMPPAKGRPEDAGARDWSNLGQRMRYIAYLFRVYHQLPEIYERPFTESQTALIRRGIVPSGEL